MQILFGPSVCKLANFNREQIAFPGGARQECFGAEIKHRAQYTCERAREKEREMWVA